MSAIAHDLRTWRFWRWFLTQTFSAIGVLAVLLELTSFIFGSLPMQGWPLAVTIGVVSVGYGLIRAWPRPIRQEYNSPNTMIEIVNGDLFAQETNIVIGPAIRSIRRSPTSSRRAAFKARRWSACTVGIRSSWIANSRMRCKGRSWRKPFKNPGRLRSTASAP